MCLGKLPDAALKRKNVPLFTAFFRRTIRLNRSQRQIKSLHSLSVFERVADDILWDQTEFINYEALNIINACMYCYLSYSACKLYLFCVLVCCSPWPVRF